MADTDLTVDSTTDPKIAQCFVIMPFGVKPKNDGTDATYDFDKIYDIVIRRAIRQAGMEPIRADETKGSRNIHEDMFKDLRDRPIVLADLSLFNPNVLYELGIRHVMSKTGTVLMCCKDWDRLPFDIVASRVIFYEYDGKCLDWQVAEDLVKELQAAILDAKGGKVDSPVHSFLQKVLSDHDAEPDVVPQLPARSDPVDDLENYQQMLVEYWVKAKEPIPKLIEAHCHSTFGARALGYLCLKQKSVPPEAGKIAQILYGVGQYGLANRVYEQIEANEELPFEDLLLYGASVAEAHHSISGFERGLTYMDKALDLVLPRLEDKSNSGHALNDVAKCYHEMSRLHMAKWQKSNSLTDLAKTIEVLQKTEEYDQQLVNLQPMESYSLEEAARTRLLLMLLLRVSDSNREREDRENYRGKILELPVTPDDHPRDLSYLSWYQVIILADKGEEEESQRKAIATLADDGRVMNEEDCFDIGHQQYTALRGLIEQFMGYWYRPELVARISKLLLEGQGS